MVVKMDNYKISINDILSVITKPYPDFEIMPGKTALLLIDMQKLVSVDFLANEAIKAGLPESAVREVLRDFAERVREAVVNSQKLLKACREKGFDVIHVKLEAPTKNPRHTAKINRKVGLIIPPSTEASEFLDAVKPIKGELVFAKTNGGAFSGTNIDFVLRNMDINSLIICGFLTDQCVLATAIHAADLGYDVILVKDGCTAFTREAHEAIINSLKDVAFKVKTTSEVLKMIQKAPVSEKH